MAHDNDYYPASPLPEPGQRVAVFLDDDASGATLGYYGEFLRISRASLLRRVKWGSTEIYRVYVPFLRRIIDVSSDNVFVCPKEEPPKPESPPWNRDA
jgi:hypothetical protein